MAKRFRWTYELVFNLFEQYHYKLISTEDEITNEKGYVLAKTKLKVVCPEGHEWITNLNVFYNNGSRCPKCANKIVSEKQKLSYEYVKNKIEKEKYKLLSTKYENAHKHLEIECDKGHIFSMSWNSWTNGSRCPECAKKHYGEYCKLTYEEVKEYIESFGYKLLSTEYINNYTKLDMICPNGHECKISYANFQQGTRCIHCNTSNGEDKIMDYLKENNISFIYNKQYFKDLICENILRPDFIIENKKIWIEFDGQQHFKYGCFKGNLLDLMNIKYKDNIKNKYAKENGWKLIRIPYWDSDKIEEILNKEIKGE